MTAFNTTLPLLSIFLGAAITYLLNVRQRRRNYVEDLINTAIVAVSAAEISVDFIASVSRPTLMTDEDFEKFRAWLITEGMKAWATKVAQANEALASVVPYRPGVATLLPFAPDAGNRGTHTAVIDALRFEDR